MGSARPPAVTVLARRFLLVLPIFAAGIALAAIVVNPLADPQDRDLGLLISLRFVLAVSVPLLAIARLWRVPVAPSAAVSAGILIAVSFPVLFFGGIFVAGIIDALLQPWAEHFGFRAPQPFVPAMMIASAVGARFVAAALRKLTRREARTLRRAMWIWGACWPLLLFVYPRGFAHVTDRELAWLFGHPHTWIGPFSILAWQIPIGLGCVFWLLRAVPAPGPLADRDRDRTGGAA